MDELLRTIATARLILPPGVSIQAPPNLADAAFPALMTAGINDWGGVSPVTPDHVNPERPWPAIARLEAATVAVGRRLAARLPAYPAFLGPKWQDDMPRRALLAQSDAEGLARQDPWSPGLPLAARPAPAKGPASQAIERIVVRAVAGEMLDEGEIVALFAARGPDVAQADALRRSVNGDEVTFVVNRNINYTNICSYKCSFCAFSKGRGAASQRGVPYDLDLSEVARRASEAVARGAFGA